MSDFGDKLRKLKKETGIPLKDLSVLASNNEPFRLNTPVNHTLGKWFLKQLKDAGLPRPGQAAIHIRGVFYVLVTRQPRMLNGKPFLNTFNNWKWLNMKAAKAGRWLGYVPFDQIIDERNDAPIIRPAAEQIDPELGIGLSGCPDLSDPIDPQPVAMCDGTESPQKYRLVFFGEKTSLEAVLGPLAEEYHADLYLASGEQTDSNLYRIARDAEADGRKLIVFVFADCDPAGYQMVVSLTSCGRSRSSSSTTSSFRSMPRR